MNTRPLRMLSGAEMVDRGRNAAECILPEIGTKEVIPNGSWMQTKQIQTALEARRVLVAGERIDKVGALSHAEWRDQQRLAEVTQQVGGHWQYMGNNVNGTFFLLPEEALYLIETNCLLLKHNEVTVSLQKAYSLLLDDNMTLTKYKVYASLSRLGYKVFRHDKLKPSDSKMETKESAKMDTNNETMNNPANIELPLPPEMRIAIIETSNKPHNGNNSMDLLDDNIINMSVVPSNKQSSHDGNDLNKEGIPSIDKHGVIRLVTKEDSHTNKTNANTTKSKPRLKMLNIYEAMQQKLKKRKIAPSDPNIIQDNFKNIPDCFNKEIITVSVPSEDYLPRNVFLNKTSYVLNMQNLKSKRNKSTVENRAMYRTLRNSSESETAAVPTPELPQYLPNVPMFLRPFGFNLPLRPRYQIFNQRPPFPRFNFNQHSYFYRMMHFAPQHLIIRPPFPRQVYQNPYRQPFRKRPRHNVKDVHYQAIKNFANRLKQFQIPPNNSVRSLVGLVERFNEIYNEKVRFTPDFEIINYNEDVETVETIELDDDEVETKKPKLANAKFDKYLANVQKLAAKLKNLERKNQPVAKQKRALCNLLKNFNVVFNAGFELDSKGALVDKKLVVLDSSSDSDVVAEEIETTKEKKRSSNGDDSNAVKSKKRKLLNPFNFLKKVNAGAGTSQSIMNKVPDVPEENNSTDLLRYFDKNWLPNDEDFGRATPCPKIDALHLWSDSQELYDFISWIDVKTWVDVKKSFCVHMTAVSNFEHDLDAHSRDHTTECTRLKPLLGERHELNNDWSASLEKLRIIKTDVEVQETSLRLDFDVYNRDVQNFRKTDPPKPHFRVVCVDESSKFPTGAEVRAIHERRDDNVTPVFAVVGIGSITYLQINPKDLPIYEGND